MGARVCVCLLMPVDVVDREALSNLVRISSVQSLWRRPIAAKIGLSVGTCCEDLGGKLVKKTAMLRGLIAFITGLGVSCRES